MLVGFTGTIKSSLEFRPVYINLAGDGVHYFADDGIVRTMIGSGGYKNQPLPLCFVVLVTGLDAGAHNFKLRWKTQRANIVSIEITSLHPQFWAKEL